MLFRLCHDALRGLIGGAVDFRELSLVFLLLGLAVLGNLCVSFSGGLLESGVSLLARLLNEGLGFLLSFEKGLDCFGRLSGRHCGACVIVGSLRGIGGAELTTRFEEGGWEKSVSTGSIAQSEVEWVRGTRGHLF